MLSDAVMVTGWLAPITPVDAVNEAEEDPAGTDTDAGIVKMETFDANWTRTGAAAGCEIVTPQVAVSLLRRLVGEQDSADTSGAAASVTVADCAVPLADAVTTAVWLAATAEAVPLKDELVEPAGMVRLVGRVSFALLLEMAMAKPPAGAGAEIAT